MSLCHRVVVQGPDPEQVRSVLREAGPTDAALERAAELLGIPARGQAGADALDDLLQVR